MRTEMDDPAYIADMLEASKDIRQFLKGVTQRFLRSMEKIQASAQNTRIKRLGID